MKQPFYFLFCFILLAATTIQAQDVIRLQECNNPSIKQQADSLKRIYLNDGFQVVREASIAMESEYEMPVVTPLQQGTWYQFVFIGEPTSRLYEVRMFDWNEKQVVYQKKMWGDIDGNIITYSKYTSFFRYTICGVLLSSNWHDGVVSHSHWQLLASSAVPV